MRFFLATAVIVTLLTPLPVQSQTAEAATEAVNTKEADSRHLLQQGLAAQTTGDYHQAEIAYREAIQLNDKDPIAHYNLGNVLAEQSKVAEAIAAYQTAISLDPTNAKAHYNLGYWLSTQGDTQQAIAAYRIAARLNPFEADTYYNLSLLLRSQNTHTGAPTETDLTEAEVMMNRAILLNPDYALITETKSAEPKSTEPKSI